MNVGDIKEIFVGAKSKSLPKLETFIIKINPFP